MKGKTLVGFLILSTLAGACASTLPRREVASSRSYSSAEVQRIMALREWGEGLATVAKEVGGTRADVRLAERNEVARRRELRHAARTGRSRDTETKPMLANR